MHLKYLSGHVWGEVWDWGEGQEGFSLCTFQSSTLYSNTLFKFLKLRCVYVLLVQLKTKLIKKIRPVSFLRPNIYIAHKQEDPWYPGRRRGEQAPL